MMCIVSLPILMHTDLAGGGQIKDTQGCHHLLHCGEWLMECSVCYCISLPATILQSIMTFLL